jgi:hypothetical protein
MAPPSISASSTFAPTGDDQRRGELRVPSHDVGADELGPAVLLVDPGVPGDQQHAHQRGQDEEEQAVDAGDVPLDGDVVAAVAGAEHGTDRSLHEAAQVLELLLGLEDLGQRRPEVEQQHGDAQQPGGELDPIATQDEPDQRAGAGEALPPATVDDPAGARVTSRTAVAVIAPPPRAVRSPGCRCRRGASSSP